MYTLLSVFLLVFLLVYVDDILAAAKSAADIQHVNDRLTKVRHLGEAQVLSGHEAGQGQASQKFEDDTGACRHRACESELLHSRPVHKLCSETLLCHLPSCGLPVSVRPHAQKVLGLLPDV